MDVHDDASMRRMPGLVLWFVGGLIALAVALAAAAVSSEAAVEDLTRDPVAVLEGPWWVGSLSTVGVIGWVVAATLFLTGATHSRVAGGDPERSRWLRAAGVLAAVLAADDALLLHEEVGPSAGIPERLVLAVIGAVTVFGLVRWRQQWTRADAVLLWGALLAFGFSLGVDLVVGRPDVEDVAKLVGIMALVAYAGSSWVAVVAAARDAIGSGGGAPPRTADGSPPVPWASCARAPAGPRRGPSRTPPWGARPRSRRR